MELNPALFMLPQDEMDRYGIHNLIYGSLTTRGVQQMIHTIQQMQMQSNIEGLDLGCGDGELIYHLQEGLKGSQWYGVELSASRVEKQRRPVMIWEGDMLEENLREYNVLHADNLCLEDAVAEALEAKIVREFRGLYITYRTPSYVPFLQQARRLLTQRTETTWGIHPIHYYRL
jgi:hypothetical protein